MTLPRRVLPFVNDTQRLFLLKRRCVRGFNQNKTLQKLVIICQFWWSSVEHLAHLQISKENHSRLLNSPLFPHFFSLPPLPSSPPSSFIVFLSSSPSYYSSLFPPSPPLPFLSSPPTLPPLFLFSLLPLFGTWNISAQKNRITLFFRLIYLFKKW